MSTESFQITRPDDAFMLFSLKNAGSFVLNLYLSFEPIKIIIIHSLAKRKRKESEPPAPTQDEYNEADGSKDGQRREGVWNNKRYGFLRETLGGGSWWLVLGSPHDVTPKGSSSAQRHSQPMLLPIANCSHISHPFQMSFSISFLIFLRH
jgi:hypothetical protein